MSEQQDAMDPSQLGKGNWAGFTIPLEDIFKAAAEWREALAGVERPWLCWNVSDRWCKLQQRLIQEVGWTPVIGFDPRSGPPASLLPGSILIDFNTHFKLPVMWPHFPLEFAHLFSSRMAFWHADLLCRLEVMHKLRDTFESLPAGAVAAGHVVVATGYQGPKIPTLAADIKPEIRQLHASGYKNASQLSGDVLVVGAGTSGVEIAIEAARAGHKTVLAGRGTGAIPPIFYAFEGKFFWFYANKIASVRTPMGRRMKPLVLHHGAPLIRVTMREALAAGVERAARVTAVDAGLPVCDGGRRLQPETIVWCTGFARDYSWIRFPVAGADGYPTHVAGVADGEKGLYFMGLPFQTRLASGLIGGQGPDATVVAETIAKRLTNAGQVALPTSAPVAA